MVVISLGHTLAHTSLHLFGALCSEKCNLFKNPNFITAAGLQLTCKLVSVQDLAKCDDTRTHTHKEKTAEDEHAAL